MISSCLNANLLEVLKRLIETPCMYVYEYITSDKKKKKQKFYLKNLDQILHFGIKKKIIKTIAIQSVQEGKFVPHF